MAKRPLFIPNIPGDMLVQQRDVTFHWSAGLAPSQKKKNITALHEAAKLSGLGPILEVSTKSSEDLGLQLSAFNLIIETDSGPVPLESIFQGSKLFEHGGPYRDLFTRNAFESKRDPRTKTSGCLVGFRYDGVEWELEPKTAFYDWLYLHAAIRISNVCERLSQYSGFSDIEFNPERSLNCQARTCALLVSLHKRGILTSALKQRTFFLELLSKDSRHQSHTFERQQGEFF